MRYEIFLLLSILMIFNVQIINSSQFDDGTLSKPLEMNTNVSNDHNWNFDLINTSLANQLSLGDESVIIAVIDSGFDFRYDFINMSTWTNTAEIPNDNIDNDANGYIDDVYGWDFVNNDNNPMDDQGHGTFIASLILGLNDNEIHPQIIPGISPGITLLPLKVLDEFNFIAASQNFVDAVEYAVNKGAQIISMSIWWTFPPQSVIDVLNWAYDQGVLIVGITGNDAPGVSGEITDLGKIDGVMATGSVNRNMEKSEFSQFGPNIEIIAPGEDIFGLELFNRGFNLTSSYFKVNDTSYSFLPLDFSNITISPITSSIEYVGLGFNINYTGKDVNGKMALIDRGAITFVDKVTTAQSYGAIGVIIANNAPGNFYGTLGSFQDLPAISISQEDGTTLKGLLASNTLIGELNLESSNVTLGSGTSFSAPLVAGTAGLMYSVDFQMNNIKAREILKRTATDLNETNFDIYIGYGLLNASLAVEASMDKIKPKVTNMSAFQNTTHFSLNFTAQDIVGLYNISIEVIVDDIRVDLIQLNFQGQGKKLFKFASSSYPFTANGEIIITVEDLGGNVFITSPSFNYIDDFPLSSIDDPTTSISFSTTTSSPTITPAFEFLSLILVIPIALFLRRRI